MRILILAALPQETGPFRRNVRSMRRVRGLPFKAWSGELGGNDLFLCEMGMGEGAVRRVCGDALDRYAPGLVLSTGFCGALTEAISVAGVVYGQGFRTLAGASGEAVSREWSYDDAGRLFGQLESRGLTGVRMVTVEKPAPKVEIAGRARVKGPAVVDMETADVARLAAERFLPFVSIRSVSDGLHDGIGFDLDDITDGTGEVSIPRVLGMILRRPSVVRTLFGHWRRTVLAAGSLDEELRAFVGISSERLAAMVRGLVPFTRT